jgi:myo-inositol-1(or 4)-monophosphatase
MGRMSTSPGQSFAALAVALADEAASMARKDFGRAHAAVKPDGSEVSDTDVAIQRMIVQRITAAYPDHAVLGEEVGYVPPSGDRRASPAYCWITDPLDGTRNFVHGVPIFATAIAVLEHGQPVLGLVRSLLTDDVYLAVRGAGSTCNGRPIAASSKPVSLRTMVALQSTAGGNEASIVQTLAGGVVLRNLGSTALHLALVASGGMVGAVASECKFWDLVAGALLVEESGGRCTNWAGDSWFPIAPDSYHGQDLPFVAAGPGAYDELLAKVKRVKR